MIESIELCNFKCFEKQTLVVKPLTVLTGFNGAGKSTVLQALLLLRQSQHQGLLKDHGLALNGECVSIGTASDALFEGASKEEISLAVWHDGGKEARWTFKYLPQVDVVPIANSPSGSECLTTSLFSDSFQHLTAERIGPRPSFEMYDFQVRRRRQIGSRGEYTAHFLSVFEALPVPHASLLHASAASTRLKDEVEAWLGEITPGTRLQLEAHLGFDRIGLKFAFVLPGRVTNGYRGTNVGFGLTYTLPIIVAALAMPVGGLLLVENPEAHLHPAAQSRIGRFLARVAASGIQVIVETHSDHVLNGIRLAVRDALIDPQLVAVHFFARTATAEGSPVQVTSPVIDKDGRVTPWVDGFFDEWDKSLDALLEPK